MNSNILQSGPRPDVQPRALQFGHGELYTPITANFRLTVFLHSVVKNYGYFQAYMVEFFYSYSLSVIE